MFVYAWGARATIPWIVSVLGVTVRLLRYFFYRICFMYLPCTVLTHSLLPLPSPFFFCCLFLSVCRRDDSRMPAAVHVGHVHHVPRRIHVPRGLLRAVRVLRARGAVAPPCVPPSFPSVPPPTN